MDTPTLITIIVVVVVIVVAAVVLLGASRRRKTSEDLQDRFGPEYERTVAESGDRKDAEKRLTDRTERRDALEIRDLDANSRQRYVDAWTQTQGHFVDEPSTAVSEAHQLVTRVLHDRGYPVDSFDEQADIVSVDHPEVVHDYRAAHAVSIANDQGEATTEDLREAMVHYRSLFDRLLDGPGDRPTDTQEARK